MLFLNYLIWRLFIFQNMYIEIFKFSCDFNFLSKIKKKGKNSTRYLILKT